MIYTVTSNEMISSCESKNHKDAGVLSIDAISPNPRVETGVNKLIDKMLKSKPAILTVGDNLDFSSLDHDDPSWIKGNLNEIK